ncbi:MAG: hypothetical protein KatS3mg102_2140 [Planctomycetota bacterium]|nr:MAG: hypothetical protein KatS3mg102_2140 [Planctomycetota bacterium]
MAKGSQREGGRPVLAAAAVVLAAWALLAVLAVPYSGAPGGQRASAQQPAEDGEPPSEPGHEPLPAPPAPRPVAPPRTLGGQPLPPAPPPLPPPPPVEVIDDPDVALVIDGERIERASYGEALIEEYGLRFVETYVERWLLGRRARELGICLDPAAVAAEVEQRVARLLERRYRNSRPALEAGLGQIGLDYASWVRALRRRVEHELLTAAVVRAERDVSEPALRARYLELYGADGVRRTAREIVFFTDVWRSRLFTEEDYRRERDAIVQAAEERAHQLAAQLAAGADFAALARAHSDDPMAPKGGDYGAYWRNRFGAEIDRTIERTPLGQPTPVLRSERGFVIALPYAEREGWEFRARHLLLSTRLEGLASEELQARKHAEATARAQALLARVRAGQEFAALAREHSDDPATRARGGDLGTFGSGELDPALERELRAMEPGEVRGPLTSPLGVHLLQLLAKRRRPERDERLVRLIVISTEFLDVKRRRLAGRIEELAAQRAAEAVRRLEQGADPAALVRELSEDPAALETGGELAAPLPPGTDPEVMAAFAALTPEAPVRAVRGRHGVHVLALERYERRTFEEVREALAAEIRAAPVGPEEVRAYLRRLRAAAKVQRGPMG